MPRASTASAISERWHLHGTASAHSTVTVLRSAKDVNQSICAAHSWVGM
jgi:hypothetical protein